MFGKYYKLPNSDVGGQMTTYSRVGWRYYRGNWWNDEPERFPDYPLNEYRWRVEKLTSQFGIQPTERILVLGCGLGFLPETFQWWGTPQGRICGADNSAFIQGNVVAEAHPNMQGKIVNRSMTLGAANAQMRGSLRAAAPDASGTAGWTAEFFHWVITESVLESYTAAERNATFYTALESYLHSSVSRRNVIHIVAEGWDATADGGSPGMTLQQWSATRPANSWMGYGDPQTPQIGTG